MAGEKLTSGNPNLTDLSDGFRPTQLGDMYIQLYDNEWTDAFEELVDHKQSDRKAIRTLETILLVNNIHCY